MTSSIIARREAQIYGYLTRMSKRVQTVGPGFIIFDEGLPAERRARNSSMHLESAGEMHCNWSAVSGGQMESGNDQFQYFAQFGFYNDRFRIDLPNSTLHLRDAERLLSERNGFFWGRDVPSYASPYTTEFNPLYKVYAYGQERLAAADMLFLLLEVWNIPADFHWCVKAAPFDGGRWEWGEPMA